jgi:hypothetical protein
MVNRRLKSVAGILSTLSFAVVFYNYGMAAENPYYRGKTITILEGRSAGGTGSLRTRAGAKYLVKYLPGQPSTFFQYNPTAGGVGAANQIAHLSKQDGLTIGNVSSGVFSSAIFDAPQARYKLDDFVFLGAGNPGNPTTLIIRPGLRLDSDRETQGSQRAALCQSIDRPQHVRQGSTGILCIGPQKSAVDPRLWRSGTQPGGGTVGGGRDDGWNTRIFA